MFRILHVGALLLAVIGGMLSPHVQHAPHRVPIPLWRTLCQPYQHMAATGTLRSRYVIRNDDYGRRGECITGRRSGPGFTVTESGARVAHVEPVAFPNVFVGCSWGVCSPRSGLPRRVGRVRSLVTSWSVRERARGVWAVSYDIWFDRARHTSGQAKGAEIMIWLSSRGFGANRWPVVQVQNARYHLAHWVTGHHGQRWTYIQFNRIRSTARVRNLSVKQFIGVAERHGLINPDWWLTSVEAGFEIWRGGVGLRTTSFSVRT